MDKHKKPTVRMNGKKGKQKKQDGPEEGIHFYHEQAAAAAEDSDEKEIPAIMHRDNEKKTKDQIASTKKEKKKRKKPILFAGISAVVIGSLLGVFMLYMINDIDKGLSQQDGSASVGLTADNDNEKEGSSASKTVTAAVEPLDAFVLQAGKFAEKVNADELAKKFEGAGFPTVAWKRDGYYFLFAGIANTEAQAKELAASIMQSNLPDIYVKAWSTDKKELKMTANEKEWVTASVAQWKQTIDGFTGDTSTFSKDWSAVMESMPENTKNLSGFKDSMQAAINKAKDGDEWQKQYAMLAIWSQLENITGK